MTSQPKIIQGGMGIGVSGWRLARAVSSLGQLGVVSGALLDVILARRLQEGDPWGHVRRAMDRFPFRPMVDRVLQTYFVPGGKAERQPYKPVPMHSHNDTRDQLELCMVANFVEVCLAREGHDGVVGINYLEKIRLPHLPSIYGALLAGVDYVLMGAGIPSQIPGVLDRLSEHAPATYPLSEAGAALHFVPKEHGGDGAALKRPRFLAIVASNALAAALLRRANGSIDGFVVEGPTAGGHNAPPRGALTLSASGEPVYGERDKVDVKEIRALGLPFWMAGGCGSARRLREVLELGGAGIQVGTAFAFCDESGLKREYKERLLKKAAQGTARVFTDPVASPTGFPFKVALLEGSCSQEEVYLARMRVCDLGYLREPYRKGDDGVGFRCPAEPVEAYVAKGGNAKDSAGRKCLCNALLANVGHGQIRNGTTEPPLVTSGDALSEVAQFLPEGKTSYSARDVIERLLAQ